MGKGGQTGKEFKGSVSQSHLCWQQNREPMVSNVFNREGEGRFGGGPNSRLARHVSMAMKEEQDVAAGFYLG